jgi:hypothetical protein
LIEIKDTTRKLSRTTDLRFFAYATPEGR